MIRLRNLSKWYQLRKRRCWLFRDFNLDISDGTRLGVLGMNGSGKSTMIKMLSQIEQPTRGDIDIRGAVSWPVASGSGFQPSLSGIENVRLVCRIYGILGRHMKEVSDFIYENSEIGDFFFEPIRTYSSGMQAKYLFSLSMAFEFDIYLLDEVTAVGDGRFRERCQQWLEERVLKATLIYASHSLDEVKRICNAVLVLRQGVQPRFFTDIGEGAQFYLDYLQAINKGTVST
ncbi:MAG: ABC transporter ATP-binding protein [Puniceicoccales bacterium]|jgi:capsular polysaccharide transport system ATP-binding protein|nr:ABC transporter ATP-binding protein [Puniceicoccales bacterium]